MFLGFGLADTPGGKGLLVTDIEPEGPAEKAGFLLNDLIIMVNSSRVNNIVEFDYIKETLSQKNNVYFKIRRGEETLVLEVVPQLAENELVPIRKESLHWGNTLGSVFVALSIIVIIAAIVVFMVGREHSSEIYFPVLSLFAYIISGLVLMGIGAVLQLLARIEAKLRK